MSPIDIEKQIDTASRNPDRAQDGTQNNQQVPSCNTKSPAADVGLARRVKDYFAADLRVDWLMETQLLLLTFSIGIQDAISYPDFHCFASNQTGNTVILAVGLARLDGELFNVANIGISLALFVAGAIITGQIAHAVGTQKRWWLLFTHLLQTAMVFAAGAIQAVHGARETGPGAQAALALLAFSSGAQVASMRPFRVQEITTAMATAAWVDLVVDAQLFRLNNHSRDRRALFLVALVAGSFAGAFAHAPIGSANTLIVSGAGKALVTILFSFDRPQPGIDNASDEAGPERKGAKTRGVC